MPFTIDEILNIYEKNIAGTVDPRTISWPLMSSYMYPIGIAVVYLWFTTIAGPAFMKNRRPYNIDKIVQVYNLMQIFLCAFTAIRGFYLTYSPWGKYSLWCQPVDITDDEYNHQVILISYLYFIMKHVDLVDTVFFVLRKKFTQISYLHLYHHILMSTCGWAYLRWTPNGHGFFIAVGNSTVHTFMYLYYFLASRQMTNLWWKKYLTQFQMAQFVAVVLHFGHLLVINTDCDVPKWVSAGQVFQNGYLFVLFAKFYRKAYMNKEVKTN